VAKRVDFVNLDVDMLPMSDDDNKNTNRAQDNNPQVQELKLIKESKKKDISIPFSVNKTMSINRSTEKNGGSITNKKLIELINKENSSSKNEINLTNPITNTNNIQNNAAIPINDQIENIEDDGNGVENSFIDCIILENDLRFDQIPSKFISKLYFKF
jgi:hypothetical protein